jgi:hypothetical protein
MSGRIERDISTLLGRVRGGNLDDLSADDVARLAELADRDADVAQFLARCQPPTPPPLAAPLPSAADWERVWSGVQAGGEGVTSRGPRWGRALRGWRAVAAVAAVLLFAVTWQTQRPAEPFWPVEWAEDVTISELQVYDGVPIVVAAGGEEQAITVIWSVETGG